MSNVENKKQVDLSTLAELIEWLNISSDIQEFSLKYNDLELSVSRREDVNLNVSNGHYVETQVKSVESDFNESQIGLRKTVSATSIEKTEEKTLAKDEVMIRAPMVGTFYTSPKPGAAPFVTKGQKVSSDTILCIIEVMKLMNHIEAGVDGEVVEIYVADQSPVEYNQPIMKIKKS